MEYLEISHNLHSQFNQNKPFQIENFELPIFQKIFKNLFSNKCNKENKSYYSWLNKNINDYLSNNINHDLNEIKFHNKENLYSNLFLIHNEYSAYDVLSDWLNFLIREDNLLPNELMSVTHCNLISCLVLNNINNKFDPSIKYFITQKPKSLFFIGNDAETINIIINQNHNRECFINFLIKHNVLLTADNIKFNHMEDKDLDQIIENKLISFDNKNSWHNLYAQKLRNKKEKQQISIINSFSELNISINNLPVSQCLLKSSFSDFCNLTYHNISFNFEKTLFNNNYNNQCEFLEQNKYDLSYNIISWPDEDEIKLAFFRHFIGFLNNNNIFLEVDTLYNFFANKVNAYTEDEIQPYLDIIVDNEHNILKTSLIQNKINIKNRL